MPERARDVGRGLAPLVPHGRIDAPREQVLRELGPPLLRRVVQLIREMGLSVQNVDMTLIAQTPRLATYLPAMQSNISQDLQIDPSRVNIKATTTEGMGFTGRSEGIAAQAVVLLNE